MSGDEEWIRVWRVKDRIATMAADSGVLLCPRVADRMQWGHRGAGTHRAIHQDIGNPLDVLGDATT